MAYRMEEVLNESIVRIWVILGQLLKKDTPMVDGDNPELYTLISLNDDDYRKCQMLLGMLNWITNVV